MGYERDNRDDDRGADGWRQPRQDYDRSAGSRQYGPREQGYGTGGYGADAGRNRADYGRATGAWRDRDDRSRDYDRSGRSRDEERGFLDRAGDEVRSWFGDEEAERRRERDEREAERHDRQRAGYGAAGYGSAYGTDYDRPATSGYRATGYNAAGYGPRSDADTRHSVTDSHYRSWRDRQMEQFDRDYDDYRREHQSKFDSEFHGWRTNRQTQRDSLTRVKEHQEVVGSDGKHVGTVDKVRGDTIVLTKQDTDAGGRHHSIPLSWVQSVDEKVTISKTADDAHAHWRDAERNSAFWNDGGQGERTNAPNATATATTTQGSGNR